MKIGSSPPSLRTQVFSFSIKKLGRFPPSLCTQPLPSQQRRLEACPLDMSGARKKRGITRLSDMWNLPVEQCVMLKLNSTFQPIDIEGGVFERFLGTIANKSNLCPLNYLNWRKVPIQYKDDCLKIIQSKFANEVDDGLTKLKLGEYALKSLGKKWRDYKACLKARYFDENKSKAQMRKNLPALINSNQFDYLVDYWSSVRGRQQEDNEAPNRASLYIKTHKRKDGQPVNQYAAKNIRKLEDLMSQQSPSSPNSSGSVAWGLNDAYSQVFGKERPGRVRGIGFGPAPLRHVSSTFQAYEVVEEHRKDKEKIRHLEETVTSLKDKLDAFENIEERITKQVEEQFAKRHEERFAALEQKLLNQSNFGLEVAARDEVSPCVRQKSSCASRDGSYAWIPSFSPPNL